MSKYIPSNQKHLSLDDRKYIERSLHEDTSFKNIARFLCKDPTTISNIPDGKQCFDCGTRHAETGWV